MESNYDEDMLAFGPYPPPLKARIRSEIGHLSNDCCADALCDLLDLGVRRFVLGHLSRENNTPEIARQTAAAALQIAGMREGFDYTLGVCEPANTKKAVIF